MREVLLKVYKYRLRILAGIFLAAGVVITLKNTVVLAGFCFNSRTLEDLSINGLREGICIKDGLSYTYGNIGELVGRKSTKIYVVDIGKEHDCFMEMHAEQDNYYEGDNDIDRLNTYTEGNYRDLNSEKTVNLYAVVKKEHIMFYKYFSRLFGMAQDKVNDAVAVDYVLYTVNPNDYKRNIAGGVLMMAAGGALLLYAIKGAGKELKNGEDKMKKALHQENLSLEPLGLFTRGILDGRKILAVELVLESSIKVFEDSLAIQRIMEDLDSIVSLKKDTVCGQEGNNKQCTFIFRLEDYTFLQFEVWDKPMIKSVGGFYPVSEEAYDDLIQLMEQSSRANIDRID